MGVCYAIVCDDCKISRDLGKFYTALGGPDTRLGALEYMEDIKGDAFRSALLVGFVGQHKGHRLRFLDDLSWSHNGLPEDTYANEDHFWKVESSEVH